MGFTWDDKYLIGHDEVDDQHRTLFEILNRQYAAMKAGQGERSISTTLAELLDYAQSHFAAEESIMLANDYPELAEHVQQHRQFTQQVLRMTRLQQAGEGFTTFEVLTFIGEWIVNHVGRADARIGMFLHQKK